MPRRIAVAPARRPRAWTDALQGIVPDRVLFSPWLRRLAGISFLGALDHAPSCRQRTSRLEHSAGVAALALSAARAMALGDHDARLLVTAALLHDVGHYPLSHTAEPAFKARLGADHHRVSEWIVQGGGPIAERDSLSPALKAGGLDPAELWAVLSGDDASPLSPLLAGTLTADTLDGIPRAARAFGRRAPAIPSRWVARRDGILVVPRPAVAAIDSFWRAKGRVYRDVINAPAHAALDLRLSAIVGHALADDVLDDLQSFDDAALLRMLSLDEDDLAPTAAELSARYVASASGERLPVRVLRQYDVDESVGIPDEGLPVKDWPKRWRTSRHRWFLLASPQTVQMVLPGCWETEGDLP